MTHPRPIPAVRSAWFLVLAAASLVTLIPSPPVARAEVAANNLVAAWTFDASNGADSSGNGLALTTISGGTFVTSVKAMGLQFGPLDYAERSFSPALTPGARSWSVATWVRVVVDTSRVRALVTWYRCGANASCSTPDAASYLLTIQKDDRVHWNIRDDAGVEFEIRATRSISDGNWHHVAGIYSVTTHLAELYLDGVRVDTTTKTLGVLSDGGVSVPLSIGRMFRTGWGVPGQHLGGTVDEVRIFDKALSVAEVQALYHVNPQVRVAPMGAAVMALGSARPNPSRARTTIPFTLQSGSTVRLVIHDVAGREVAVLAEGPFEAGPHIATWDGLDREGRATPGGVYFARLAAGGRTVSRVVVRVR